VSADRLRAKLCELISKDNSIANDPKRCKGLLLDYCGDRKKEINVLINAMNEGVVSDLISASIACRSN
jgi:hypothetical protein